MLNRLFVLMLALSLWGGPVSAAPPDLPTVKGFPALFFTDALLRQYYPVATGTPLPVDIGYGRGVRIGFIEMGASRTAVIGPHVPVNLSLYLPAGATGFAANVFNGQLLVGARNLLSTGTLYCGFPTASGTQYYQDNLSSSPNTWAVGNGATVTLTLSAWGVLP